MQELGTAINVGERKLGQRFVLEPNGGKSGVQARCDILFQTNIEMPAFARVGVHRGHRFAAALAAPGEDARPR